jgi:hypothetical protein
MSEWIMLVPLKVFTKIKADFSTSIKETYKITDANFSTVGNANKTAVFPFVYVQGLPASEQGADLQGTSINGALFTFQVDVTDNQTQTRARKVMTDVIRIMKTMGFEIVSMPSFEGTQDNTHRMTARFRRLIGANDIF